MLQPWPTNSNNTSFKMLILQISNQAVKQYLWFGLVSINASSKVYTVKPGLRDRPMEWSILVS